MLIDCDGCEVRGLACGDCVVTVLLATPTLRPTEEGRPGEVPTDSPGELRLDQAECDAIGVLAESGMVPPLRMLRRVAG